MKLPFKVTPIRLVLATVVVYAALSAMHLGGPSEKEQMAETDRCLLEALQENPKDPVAHYLRALLHLKMGDMAVARSELDAAKSIDPTGDFAGHDGVGAGAIALVERDIAIGSMPSSGKPYRMQTLVAGGIFVSVLSVGGLVAWRRRAKAKADTPAVVA